MIGEKLSQVLQMLVSAPDWYIMNDVAGKFQLFYQKHCKTKKFDS